MHASATYKGPKLFILPAIQWQKEGLTVAQRTAVSKVVTGGSQQCVRETVKHGQHCNQW